MKDQNKSFKIKLIGVGDYGIYIIEALGEMPNVESININTDWASMGKSNNPKLKIGKNITKGIGTGGLAEFGKKAAEEDKEIISKLLKDSDIAIIVAGLGGGTGSGATPIVAKVAQELHIPTIVFVTTPFRIEGKIRFKNSDYSIEKLQNVVDALVVISADRELELFMKKPLVNFYAKVDKVLQKNIINLIKLFDLPMSKKSILDILKNFKVDICF